MNNINNYAFKLVCVDENDPMSYTVLEDCNRDNLEEIYNELLQRMPKYNIANTKWMLLPILKV